VAYHVNRGYIVAGLDDDDLTQIFEMRSLLERELLSILRRPDEGDLAQLTTLNAAMIDAIDVRAAESRHDRNRAQTAPRRACGLGSAEPTEPTLACTEHKHVGRTHLCRLKQA
jgi:hypothetical protein